MAKIIGVAFDDARSENGNNITISLVPESPPAFIRDNEAIILQSLATIARAVSLNVSIFGLPSEQVESPPEDTLIKGSDMMRYGTELPGLRLSRDNWILLGPYPV